MKPLFSVIIPTWNNPQYLTPCVNSIIRTGILSGLGEIIIINNGKQPIKEQYRDVAGITVLDPGENLGWERGLALGLEHSKTEFVCFQNDDTLIPYANSNLYHHMLYPFNDQNVAAVGPSTTVAAGWHSVLRPNPLVATTEVSYLIFFTVMIRREYLDSVGGIDTACPGGDDFDLSIRFRNAGKNILIAPEAFLIHFGFKTGERVHGTPDVAGGWNSKEMSDATTRWLIQKHGFKTYMKTIRGLQTVPREAQPDKEGGVVRELATGQNVLELGCGGLKTVERAVGIDVIPKGEPIPHVPGALSVADITADVSKPLPLPPLSQDTLIARHILEHCVDAVATLKNWGNVLKMGGRLIIAVPNQTICNSIPLNPEHVHAFTPDSLKKIMELCGFKQVSWSDPQNGLSFVGCYEKVLHEAGETNGKALEMAAC